MTERTQRHMNLVPQVARLTRSPEWLAAHPERHQTHIVVLPDDTVAYVLAMVDLPQDEPSEATYVSVDTGTGLRVFRLTEVTPGGAAFKVTP